MGISAVDLLDYYVADRLCRKVRPAAQDYFKRSVALARLGFLQSAAVDLETAEEVGARDLHLLRWLLRHHPDRQKRCHAARSLLTHDQAGRADVADALNDLFSNGEQVVHHAARRGAQLYGWVAGLDGVESSVDLLLGDGRRMTYSLVCDAALLGNEDEPRATFRVPTDRSLSVLIRGLVGRVSSQPTIIYPEVFEPAAIESPFDPSIGMSVIVPIYGDADSLRACLQALAQQSAIDTAFIVIDDASPDQRVAEIGRQFCHETNGIYHRSLVNGGFAAAVNLGLSICSSGDVLLLNSDVILPPGALDRLRSAARSSPDIGTITPLSNDSGAAGFPDPLCPNPALDAAESIDIDKAAQAANPNQVVDILAALGSCLYVTRAALKEVGFLSLAYGRGYYEDVELYLRVRQAGLRNVAACNVYVSHLGGRSFGFEKRALVARNRSVIRRRFPSFELDDVVFDFANPLRKCRAAIEGRLRPDLKQPVIVVGRAAGSQPLFDQRLQVWGAGERQPLLIRWRSVDDHVFLDLVVPQGPGPRSLHYDISHDSKRVLAYLAAFKDVEIEVLEPETVPSALVGLLEQVQRPISLVIDSLASTATMAMTAINPLETRRSSGFVRWPARCRFVPLDRMAASWLEPTRYIPPSSCVTRSRPIDQRIERLGVSLPTNDAAAERLILSLARVLRREHPKTVLVVFGRAIDENQLMSPGNVWVTGPLLADDPAIIAEQYKIDAFLSPHRGSMFWHVESLGNRLGVPIAYFDWSADRSPNAPSDLPLNYGLNDADACQMILAWVGGVRSPICVTS